MKFEQRKINDVRKILLEFTLIQLNECVKSVETLTTMYNDIVVIDADKDLEVREVVYSKKEKYRFRKE